MKFLLFLTLVFLSTSLQAQKTSEDTKEFVPEKNTSSQDQKILDSYKIPVQRTLKDAEEFVKTHTPEEIASSLFSFITLNSSLKAIIHLVENGADVNAKTEFGFTPLHAVAMSRHATEITEKADYLIEKGADVNAQGQHNSTPSHLAAQMDNVVALIVFINNKANLNAMSKYESTVYKLAAGKAKEFLNTLPHHKKYGTKACKQNFQ